jgi:hypothetical protein
MVAAALCGVAFGIGLVARQSMRWALRGRLELGLATVGIAAIAAFAVALLVAGSAAALAVPAVATLVGFAVALFSGGDDDGGVEPDGDPPWWPSFERDLRRYERTRRPAGRR